MPIGNIDLSNCIIKLINRVTGEVIMEFKSIKEVDIIQDLKVLPADRTAMIQPAGRDVKIGVSGTPIVPDIDWSDSPYSSLEEALELLKEN